MPIPAFNEYGVLPEGVHDCTLEEAAGLLCFNARRQLIWAGFVQFRDWVSPLPASDSTLIDGSFVTDKADPNDVDVVVEITSCSPAAQTQWMATWNDGHDFAKENFSVDFYPFAVGHGHDFSAFFQYLRIDEALKRGLPPTARKGILRIVQ